MTKSWIRNIASLCTPLLALAAGCGTPATGDAAHVNPNCSGPTMASACSHKSDYVLSDLLLPPTATQASTAKYAIRLDGDPRRGYDNQLGLIFAVLSGRGFDLQGNVENALHNGKVILLWQYYAAKSGFPANDSPDALQAFLGMGAGSSMCMLPPDGGGAMDGGCNFFTGSAMFTITSSSPTDAFFAGATVGGAFSGGPTTLALDFPFSSTAAPVSLTLYGARVTGQLSAAGVMHGVFGGGLKLHDINFNIIPAIAAILNADIAKGGSTATNILTIFDGDCSAAPDAGMPALPCIYAGDGNPNDCECDADMSISPQEIVESPIIKTTLEKADLDLFDGCLGMSGAKPTDPCAGMGKYDPLKDGVKDSLSMGLAWKGVTAVITNAP